MKRFAAKKVLTMGDVANISAGYPLRGAADALPAGDVAVIQMSNVDPDAGVDWAGVKHVTLPSQRSASFLAPGDVIFTTRGSRNLAQALTDIPGPAVCSPHFFVFRVHNPSQIAPEFLAWQMNQRPAQEYFQREATGSYILNLRREVIERLSLAIPSRAHQQAIIELAAAAAEERLVLRNLIHNRNLQMDAIALELHGKERPLS
jgi:hypothetical protein